MCSYSDILDGGKNVNVNLNS